jgi:conjugative transfer region protein TrbK
MTSRNIVAAAVFVIIAWPLVASGQNIDELLKDQKLLRSELDRCKQLGMASNGDARCETARMAKQKRFFGNGENNYTQQPVSIFNGTGSFDPQPNSQKQQLPSN